MLGMATSDGPALRHIDPARLDASRVGDGMPLYAHCKALGIERSLILDFAKEQHGWSRTTTQNAQAARDLLDFLRVCVPGSVVMLDLGQERADRLADLTPHELAHRVVAAHTHPPVLVTISEPTFGPTEWDPRRYRWVLAPPAKRRRRPPKAWTGTSLREPSTTGTQITWGLRPNLSQSEQMDLIHFGDHKHLWSPGPTAHFHHYVPGTRPEPCPTGAACQEYPRTRSVSTVHARNGDLIHGKATRIDSLTQDIAHLQEVREEFEKALLDGYDIYSADLGKTTANVLHELAAAYERRARTYEQGAALLDQESRRYLRSARQKLRAARSA